jgi:ribonuclease HI
METIITYAAGRANGNPGPAALGIYITDANGTLVQEVAQTIGNARADFAAYYAVMVALETLKQIYGEATSGMQFELRLDNEFVKKQLNAELEIKEPGLVPMFIEIHNRRVTGFPNLTFTLIPSEQNTEAGRLAEEVLAGK